jgi:hypothetical protein
MEVLGGLLLIVPRTALFGALNLPCRHGPGVHAEYDLRCAGQTVFLPPPSSGIVSAGARLSASHQSPLLNRTVAPSAQAELFSRRRANRIALTAQILFGNLVRMGHRKTALKTLRHLGGESDVDRPTTPFAASDRRRPLRRIIFDSPRWMAFQRMDDSFAFYDVLINSNDKTLMLTREDGDKNWKAAFAIQRPAQDKLILDGEMDGHRIHMLLQLTDRNKFLLVSRGFHWIQDSAFNH